MVTAAQYKHSKVYIKNVVLILGLIAMGIILSIYVVENPQDSLVSRLVSYNKISVLLKQHLYIVGVSSGLAIVTAVPVGILLTRNKFRKWTSRVVSIVNVGQTIPSLAIVALLVGTLGVGAKTAIIALWVYSLLPILNNTLIGIGGVDKAIIEAANGVGMKASHVLTKVEIPLAMPMIIAGIRTAITINIASAILAAFVGGGGLGDLIIAGNNVSRTQVLVLGAALPVLMALIADSIFGIIEQKIKV
ncbi:ABC transporter permease [Clostridium sp.]|uniref:ABC transporter permease n=1 Tax=Clostridium sp. TaxID=1506 RepID=UPI001A62DC5E|nr:ABC transporter permease [Clostridium sp.]MBK5236821.1 ABC transporter permease [Clostridium sp.]